MSKKHADPTVEIPKDTLTEERPRKIDGMVVHERIHPINNAYKDAPRHWGALTDDLKTLMKTAKDHQPFFQGVTVVDRNGCSKVFGTLAWKENGEVYTMPMLSGGTGKGALPGMICGTGNMDPLDINCHAVIQPYHIGHAYNHKWGCKVVDVSTPPGTKRDNFLMHVIRLDDESHGCPVAPLAFAGSFNRCMDVIGGHDLVIAPSIPEGGLAYNEKQQKMKALAEAHKAEHKTPTLATNTVVSTSQRVATTNIHTHGR